MAEETTAPSAPASTTVDAPADNARSVTGTIPASADGDARIAAAIAAAKAVKADAAPEAKPEAVDVEATGDEAKTEEAQPKTDDGADYRKRIRVREQQFRRAAEQDRQQAELDRQQAAAARAEVEKTRNYYQRLEHMRVNDPVAWLNETKMDLEPIVRSKIEANKPEARATQAELLAKQAIERLEAMERQAQQREQQTYRADSERKFQALATDEAKYPTVSAVYADDPGSLVQAAYSVQSQFQSQHGRLPTQEEIAFNLERIEAAKVERWQAKRGGAAPKVEAAKPAAKKTITPSSREEAASGTPKRPLTEKERVQRAMQAAKESMRANGVAKSH